jgi:multidrug efflux pump subunit AcrA (membrane-fusion protein)
MESSIRLALSAPVHNLVSVIKSEIGTKKLYLFETQDITDLYSGYLTAEANLQHSSLALARVKDLYAHDIAAAKDLQGAEQDFASQQSSISDNLSRLHAVGIDPKALGQSPAGTIWVIADMAEADITKIKPGMKVEIEYVTYPGEKFIGQLASIGQAIDPNTRKVKVRIVLSNPADKLHAAMFGTAHFTGTSQKAVTVPTTAVVREGDGTMSTWVTTDGQHFHRNTVQIGMQDDGVYQITDGLELGDHVVTSGGIFLSNMLQASETQE